MKRLYEEQAYQTEVGSWWETTAKPEIWPVLTTDIRAKTLVIGGGYTGLNCALELSKGQDAAGIVILDAQQPGWGASGRNGGFCCMGGSKLSLEGHIKRFGESETRKYFKAQQASVESVREFLTTNDIDADIHSSGETLMAHREDQISDMQIDRERMRSEFEFEPQLIEKNNLAENGMNSPEFHAALTTPVGFALNPMKYVAGLTGQVSKAGLAAYGETPALSIRQASGHWQVATPNGNVTAQNLVIATNGYSSEDIPDWLGGRLLPALTNIVVTRPLTTAELRSQGWTSHQMCYDTRNSLHYFRLMPAFDREEGPRMLFGMRAGTQATTASNTAMRQRIRADFDRIFPAWRNVETPFFWSGLVCLTRDLLSFTGPVPEMKNAFASFAYHGNGVAMGSYCGRLLAGIINGETGADELPAAMRQPPRRFPFASLRRKYLSAAYKWYEWKDG